MSRWLLLNTTFNCLIEKRVVKDGQRRIFRHLQLQDQFSFDLTVYPLKQLNVVFKSSITGKPIERASISQFEALLKQEYPHLDLEQELATADNRIDRFQLYYSLLLPLENVQQNVAYHPEGDALYHSLQVFDLACDQLPYDEEFLTAALLHDIGKAIDPLDHVVAATEALDGFITTRTSWLIENHMLAHQIRDKTIGHRAHRRLQQHESYDELVLLSDCDRRGRVPGVEVTELEAALDYLRDISNTFGS